MRYNIVLREEDTMTFNTDIKESMIKRLFDSAGISGGYFDEEISPEDSLSETEKCEAELAAYLQLASSIIFKGSGIINLRFENELESLTDRFSFLTEKLFGVTPIKAYTVKSEFGGRKTYFALIDDSEKAKEILSRTAVAEFSPVFNINQSVHDTITGNAGMKKCYLKGAFLSTGFINDPKKSYLLQFSINTKALSDDICDSLRSLGLSPSVRVKDSMYVVSIRKAEEVSDFMAYCEAYSAVLLFQEQKALKDMNNTMNRKVNCDTANIQKTVEASMNQVAAINKLINAGIFSSLSPKLIEAGQLRLDNPEESLSDLAKLPDPPINRSTLDKRLRKLISLAEEL